MPRNKFDATCDNFDCLNTIQFMKLDQARVKGWHIFEGPTMGGEKVTRVLCPTCVGQRRNRLPAPERLEGEVPLF